MMVLPAGPLVLLPARDRDEKPKRKINEEINEEGEKDERKNQYKGIEGRK